MNDNSSFYITFTTLDYILIISACVLTYSHNFFLDKTKWTCTHSEIIDNIPTCTTYVKNHE